MRRIVPMLAAVLVASVAVAADSPPGRRMAFERSGGIWVAGVDGSGAVRLVDGADPSIAPDGKTIAYTRDRSGKHDVHRNIAVVDVETKAARDVAKVPSDNAWGPAFSPDGRRLLFYLFDEHAWQIGLVDAAGGDYRVVRKTDENHTCYGAAWAADGKSFFCQDMQSIRRISLEGGELWAASIESLVVPGDLNSGARLAPSADGTSLLVDVDLDEETTLAGWDGPPPAVFRIDLAAKTAKRLSPPKMLVWEPTWLSATVILCIVQRPGDHSPGIARMPAAGGEPVPVLANARMPSVAAPR